MIVKHLRRTVFVFLLTTVALCAVAQEQQKEAFAKNLAEILKAKNEPAFVKLFPDYPEMMVIMKEIFAATGQQLDSAFLGMFTEDKYQKEMVDEMGEKFRKFIEKGEEKGITWGNTSLLSYTLAVKEDEDDGPFKSDKMKMYAGELELKSGEKTYIVKFNESLWWGASQKFYGADLRKVFEKGMEEPDEEEWGDGVAVDSAMAVADTAVAIVEPAQPPPPKKKATAPAKPKTNTKPKTAARKPKS